MPSGPIVRQWSPLNLESPLSTLESFLTPTADFYVRSHFEVPQIDPSTWRVRVEGAVQHPFAIMLDELRALPAVTKVALLECAGNGRIFLVPKAKGLLWESGAVGNAEWLGVPLGVLLDRAGVNPAAVEVILEGADSGEVSDEPKTPGVSSYARSLSLAKAQGDVLLAYAMNGSPLTPSHGAPIRAVVPGWYGMASVKWLSRVIVTEKPFHGYFQTLEYSVFEEDQGAASLVGLTQNAVKSQIIRPERGEVVAAGADDLVRGIAWAGEANVTTVEISADDGQTWTDARLLGDPVPHAWRHWEATWQIPNQPGECRLLARASDDSGRTQPAERDKNLRTFVIHHTIPVAVTIEA